MKTKPVIRWMWQYPDGSLSDVTESYEEAFCDWDRLQGKPVQVRITIINPKKKRKVKL